MVLRIGSSSDISSFNRMNESLKGFALFWPNKRAGLIWNMGDLMFFKSEIDL